MNHKLFATLSGLCVCAALLIVGLVSPESSSGGNAASRDLPLAQALQAQEPEDPSTAAQPVQRRSQRKRGALSMPYFSFAQSLRPRG